MTSIEASQSHRKSPKLESTAGYAVWKPLMEHYLLAIGMRDVLKVNITKWKSMAEMQML